MEREHTLERNERRKRLNSQVQRRRDRRQHCSTALLGCLHGRGLVDPILSLQQGIRGGSRESIAKNGMSQHASVFALLPTSRLKFDGRSRKK